ncbi:MAG: hypothetical protein JSV65_08345 [Armatimonadota bacterium]|nr:MAG: hypothetical protein JSV65_08345 [Armatimonadota bacterium]
MADTLDYPNLRVELAPAIVAIDVSDGEHAIVAYNGTLWNITKPWLGNDVLVYLKRPPDRRTSIHALRLGNLDDTEVLPPSGRVSYVCGSPQGSRFAAIDGGTLLVGELANVREIRAVADNVCAATWISAREVAIGMPSGELAILNVLTGEATALTRLSNRVDHLEYAPKLGLVWRAADQVMALSLDSRQSRVLYSLANLG